MNPHEIDYYLPEEFKYKNELLTDTVTSDFVKIKPYGTAIIKSVFSS